MRKETIIASIIGVSMVLVIGGVGFAMWRAAQPTNAKKTLSKTDKKTTSDNSETSLGVGDGSGLGGGIDLGQGGGQGQSMGGSGEANSESTKKPKFTEYEKYKQEKSALFADLAKGTGPDVKVNSKVAIYYKGYLLNGEVFDNQWPATPKDTPKPFEFQIGSKQIIPGLQQGLVGMMVGGKRLVIVPPAVGYGEKGYGSIPPDSVLVFEVELLKVE